MLDSDIATLYQVETKRINEAVKNNKDKFPNRFSFKLEKEEYENLRSKISTSKDSNYGGRRYIPRVSNGAIEIKLSANQINEVKENLMKFYNKVDKKPKFMCIIYGLWNNAVREPETGIYILPIYSLRP